LASRGILDGMSTRVIDSLAWQALLILFS